MLFQNTSFAVFDHSTDPNIMYDILLKGLHEILEIMCPLRKYRCRQNSGPWMNAEIFRAMKYRKFYVSLFKQTPLNKHLQLSHVWRNHVNTMIDNAKALNSLNWIDMLIIGRNSDVL